MSFNKKSESIYLLIVFAVALPLIYVYINWLNWPSLASWVFGVVLTIHVFLLSKYSLPYIELLKKDTTTKAYGRFVEIFQASKHESEA